MIKYYLSKILGIVNSFCPRYREGCNTLEGDAYGRCPCTDTRGWIDGERCAYFRKKREGIQERISGKFAKEKFAKLTNFREIIILN